MIKKINLLVVVFLMSLSADAQRKILFVMSAANELQLANGKTYKDTGVFLSEFYLAFKAIKRSGYDIDFATPNGVASSIDKESFNKKYWKGEDTLIAEATTFIKNNPEFNKPLTLEQAIKNSADYSGLV